MFLLGAILLTNSTSLKAQQLSDDQTSAYVNTANGPQQVKVKIFGGSTACANGILALTLPTGYTYKPNSAKVIPYDAADLAGTPINITAESISGSVTNLTVPSIPVGNYVIITYDVTAGCGAETGNISYTLNACGSPTSTEAGPVNIQKAKLNITVSPETYVAASTGTTYTRNILIKNDGIGKIDTVYLDRSVASGFTYGSYTVIPSAGVTIINQTLTANRYRIITTGLAIGQSVTVAETVTINSTSNISANYDAWYGPNAAKCVDQNGTGVGSAIITATPPNPAAPGLVLAVTAWPTLKCTGASEYVTIRITNSNTTEAATLTSLVGFLNQHPGATTTNVGQRAFFLENIAEISTSGAGGPWVPLTAVTRTGGYAYTAGHNVGKPIQSSMTSSAGNIVIPPSGVYFVRYKIAYNPVSESCPSNNASYWFWPRLEAVYAIAGVAGRVNYSDDNGNNYWQIASPFNSSAPDAVGGVDYMINMNFSARLFSQAQFNDNTGYVKLVFTLPTALTPSLTPADNTISDGTSTLTPTSVAFDAGTRKLTLIFNNPLDAARFGSNVNKRWTTNIKTQFVCTGANISYNYTMDGYVQMASCGPEIKLLCGATGSFEAHACNPCGIDAATSDGATLVRTTIGTIVNPANPINLSHFVTGDRANFTVSGSVNTITPGKEFQYLFVNMNPLGLTYGTQYQFEAGTTASAIITRGGIDYTITNIPLVGTTPLSGETHTIRIHAGTMPAALGGKFLDNDLVKVIIPLRFLVNADQYLSIKGTIYAADVAEPTPVQRLYCDHGYTARGRAVLVSQSIANGANVRFDNCAQITSGLEGRTDINYMLNGSNSLKVFNNEIREFFTIPNTFTIRTRDFEQITQIRVVVNYQQGGAAPNVTFNPIGAPVPDGAGYHTFTFNLSSLTSSLADPKINQSALIQIFPRYKITCASSNFSGASNYANTYYPFSGTLSHLNQGATAVAQAVDATNGIFIPVNMTTGAAIKTIAGNTATWDVHISNIYNVVKSNLWLAPNAVTGFSSIKVFEISTIGAATTGTEVVANAAGLYQLGQMPAYGNKYYRIVGTLAECNNVQKLDIVYDFNCEGYPASLQAGKNGCRAKILNLEAHPTPASLQVSIEAQPTNPHEICNDLTYTFRINNSSLAIVKDLGLNIGLNGVNYVANSLQVATVNGLTTPAAGDYTAPATGSVTSTGVGAYDVSINGSQITAGQFIWIKVSFKPDGCNFVSGQRLKVNAHGKDVCGNIKLGDNEVLSNRINIDGVPTLLPTVEITSSATPIIVNANGSFSVSAYKLKIENKGSIAIDATSGYGFDTKLPANWTLVPASIVYNTGTATYTGINPSTGEHQFSFSGGLLPGGSVELTVPINLAKEYVSTLTCGAPLQIQESVFAKFTPTGACATTCEINHVISDNSLSSLIVPTPNAPTGNASQNFCDNAVEANKPTLANVVLTGGNFIRWYDSATKLFADSIPSTTKLVNGTTYFVRNALANNGTCQSAPFAVTVVVKPLLTLASIVENCAPNGLTYKLTVTVNGTAPFVATGTGAPGTWVGNVWTSAAIPAGTIYDINFADVNNCNTLNVKDDAPECCVFTVVCPTFAPTMVSCYSAIPTKTTYSVAEFTALGGSVSANHCGVIEITATNSADPGCNGTVTRTYRITAYEDVNANGVKDASETVVLFTQDCLQTITVKDEVAPIGTAPIGTTAINACFVNATIVPIGAPAFNAITAAAGYTDNCNGAVTATLTNTAVTGNNCAWTLTYTFEVADVCGNKLSNQTIVHTGGDKTAPTGTAPTGITNINACFVDATTVPVGAPAFNAATVAAGYTDNCSGAVTATLTNTAVTGNNCAWTLTYTFSVADACGNKLENQTIVHSGGDKTAPTGTAPTGTTNVNACFVNGITAPTGAPIFNAITAAAGYTDNCSGAVTATLTNTTVTGDNCAWTLTYTFSVADACGNKLDNQVIVHTGGDKIAPTGTAPIGTTGINACFVNATTVPAGTPAFNTTTVAASYTDNCYGTVTATLTNTSVTGNNCAWTVTYTFSVADACGNALLDEKIVHSGGDKTAPTGTAPTGITNINACYVNGTTAPVGTPAFDPVAAAAGYTDNCSGTITATLNSTAVTGNSCAWIVTYTFEVVDACGNKLENQKIVHTGGDKTAPTGAAPNGTTNVNACYINATTAPIGAPAFNAVTAAAGYTDNCGGVVTATLTNTAVTGDNCAWTLVYTFSIADACGNILTDQKITHTGGDKTAPTGTAPAGITGINACFVNATTVPVGTPAFNATAAAAAYTDNCGATVLATLTNTVVTGSNCAWTVTYTFSVADACGNVLADQKIIHTGGDKTAPTGTAPQGSSNINACFVNGNTVPSGVPAFNAIAAAAGYTDNCNGAVTANLVNTLVTGNSCAWTVTYTFTVADACGNKLENQKIIHTGGDKTAPTGTAPVGTTGINACYISENTIPTGTPAFDPVAAAAGYTDNCGSTVTAILTDTKITRNNCNWTVTYTFSIADECGNTLPDQTIIHTGSDQTAPKFVGTLPVNIKAECGAIPVAPILTATDNCSMATVTFTETKGNSTGCGSAIVRTWTATDACGNKTVHTQTITVEDNIAPVFTGTLPGNITVNCDQIPTAATLTATDNCGTPDILYNEVKTAGNCANEYMLTRTWTAKDICGNTVTHSQIIRVEDKTPPVFVGTLPRDIKVGCDAIPPAPVLAATDNCGAATVTYAEVRTVGACEETGFIITRTWTATDACGNTTIHKQIINVENTSPAITVEKIADVKIVRQAGDIIRYTIVVTNSGNLTLRNIKVVDPLTGLSETIAVLAPGEKKTFTTSYVVKISDFNSGKVINVVNANGTDPKGNPVTGTATEEVVVEPLKLNIPNVITPNGDGKNDSFYIDGLEAYPENNLIIFNRWNNEVYNSNGYYKNNWTGEGLNDGTYYYLLKIKNKSGAWQALTGFITLLRKN